ncbi:MAG TPA: HAMP domain-containing sensor histidine kinase [Polyangiaceae bacterium]
MDLARSLRSPLALRIYVVGVAQTIVCGAGFVIFHRIYRPAGAEGMPHSPSSSAGLAIIAFVLVVIGVSSWLLARMLANRMASMLRAERELLANVSHELRTPLARIRMALALASEGNAEIARQSFSDIAEDIDELERLVADILTAARLDLSDAFKAGIPPLRRERIDPGQLVAHAASRFRGAHPERSLRVDVADGLPSVEGDPVLLRRVVDNLLENAHAYSERGADPVELLARVETAGGRGLAIDVVDRGIGIAPADLPHVFTPFFRADRSRTRATGGLGLGLTLAKRIVDAHGGRLELASHPNEGTRARVWLPVR